MRTLIIDAGNTGIKLVTYENEVITKYQNLPSQDIQLLKNELKNESYNSVFLCSVLSEKQTLYIKNLFEHITIFDEKIQLPLTIDYHPKNTLGKDRLANVVAAQKLATRNKHLLIIDVGTCIKFDFINDNIYKGGSISPGIRMRFKALHEYTGRLPDIENWEQTKLIGNSSVDSITSGVINGIKFEIEGMVEAYKKQFKDLIIFATGGDFQKINIDVNFPIIFDKHLTIKGLYTIFKYQNEH